MLALSRLLQPPPGLDAPDAATAWFRELAACLLGPCRLRVAGSSCRLVELEFYYDSATHRDPFTHRHAEQATSGRWYFHRIGASYRGGSFKGIDLTFGAHDAHGGILIRSLETPTGELVVGPSLCVDHLLGATGASSVAELAEALGGRGALDASSPLHLQGGGEVEVTLFSSARVGLSLKRHHDALAVDRLSRPYRFLSEPRRVTKGRRELILALHASGRTAEDIRRLTGSPLPAIEACLAASASVAR